jgi:hypothetical protein
MRRRIHYAGLAPEAKHRIAYRLVDRNPDDDLSEYYIALVYFALKLLDSWNIASVQRQHALLSADLPAERLGLDG